MGYVTLPLTSECGWRERLTLEIGRRFFQTVSNQGFAVDEKRLLAGNVADEVDLGSPRVGVPGADEAFC